MNKVLRVFMFAGVLVGIAGCTAPRSQMYVNRQAIDMTPTPYGAKGNGIVGRSVYGHHDDGNMFGGNARSITYDANIYTSPGRTNEMALLRAAEYGKEEGYSKFRLSYQTAGAVCLPSTAGLPPRNVVILIVQYAKGDEAVGPDERWVRLERETTGHTYSGGKPEAIGTEYKVDELYDKLMEKVKNSPETIEDGKRNLDNFEAQCAHVYSRFKK